ncbi:unnamed protein product [Ophioblennius macclurei]
MAPQQLPRTEKLSERMDDLHGGAGYMASATSPGAPHPNAGGEHSPAQQEPISRDMCGSSRSDNSDSGRGKKKSYQRYPKPPYSYLAMIAMVIQRSPLKKLTLSEILKEISTLFPFFEGNYKGWRDSVRHNLSSYDCFVKVLKDPSKPQGKGNFWAVELSRVPLELLKRQNTVVSRRDEAIFAQDLAPYIMQGHKLDSELPNAPATSHPPESPGNPSPMQEDPAQPKLDSSFAIESLLHSLQPAAATSEDTDMASRDCGLETEAAWPSSSLRACYASSGHSASASSASPASSSSSEEEWKNRSLSGKRVSPNGEARSSSYDDYMQPLHKSARRETPAPPWELPTSYAKYAPPNAVAPPSMRFSGGPLMALHSGLPLYGYSRSPVTSGHFIGHGYWPIFPSRQVAVQGPPLFMDLDNMLQSVPPNKSVFDALAPATQSSYHPPSGQYSFQNGGSLNKYHQY